MARRRRDDDDRRPTRRIICGGGGRRRSEFRMTTLILVSYSLLLCGDDRSVAGFGGGSGGAGSCGPAFLSSSVGQYRNGARWPASCPTSGAARCETRGNTRHPSPPMMMSLSRSVGTASSPSSSSVVAPSPSLSRLNYSNNGNGDGEDGVGTSLAYGVAEAISSVKDLEFDVVPGMTKEEEEKNGFASVADVEDHNGGMVQGVPTKVGVLLLNLGGPETSEDVEGFLYNLFADPDIIRLPGPLAPLQKYIARGISKSRSPKSKEAYASIGGGSPILKYSNAQASLLSDALRERHGLDATCYVGMRYWHPFTEEALEKIRSDGVNALVVLPLYPQFSISTSGSSLRVLQEEFARRTDLYGPARMRHTVVDKWYDRPGYVSSMANLIREELDSFTEEELEVGGGKRHVLFSAHGVPRSYIEAGDPYQTQIQDCVDRISKLLPTEEEGVEVHLSYQSRVGPVEWLRPYTDDVLPELGRDGVKNLVVVPISFVSEHIETLEEIDIEYRELAEENGIENWRRCPALNTDGAFIEDLADLVVDALSEPVQTVTEACIANNCEIELQPFDQRLGIGTNVTEKVVDDTEARDAERINGRLAILGVAGTMLLELLSGKSLLHMFGM